jgi:hypothetical protein
MARWEEELSVLLGELGVKQEEPRTNLRHRRKPLHSDVKRAELFADALSWDEDEDEELSIRDLDMMRREVDTIVSQVVLLMQRGELDKTLKEDVIVVLRALRYHLPSAQQPMASDEAYLESASAVLHFCRLVLQLSEFAPGDF